mmetsp:Transcript_18037/g.58375  ORF Transcript_18037/g.58375 Transcript_18037/m.58375 type:complete len:755 (+) Transcript_18037:133-2397(+)
MPLASRVGAAAAAHRAVRGRRASNVGDVVVDEDAAERLAINVRHKRMSYAVYQAELEKKAENKEKENARDEEIRKRSAARRKSGLSGTSTPDRSGRISGRVSGQSTPGESTPGVGLSGTATPVGGLARTTSNVLEEALYNLFNEKQQSVVNERVVNMEIHRHQAIRWLRSRQLQMETISAGIMYIIFMCVYVFVLLDQVRVKDSFLLEGALRKYMSSRGEPSTIDQIGEAAVFKDIDTDEKMWYWMEHGLLDALFPEPMWYNGDLWGPNEENYILSYNRLVGGFRITQLRSKEGWEGCIKSARFAKFYATCWPMYSEASKDTSPYGPAHDPEKYTWEADADGGGYHVDLVVDRKKAYETLEELKKDLWTDKSTRSVSVEFVIYNGNFQLFTHLKAVIERSQMGGISTSYSTSTFRVEIYSTARDYARLAAEIIFVLFYVQLLYVDVKKLVRPPEEYGKRIPVKTHLLRYFTDFWSLVDIARFVTFAVILFQYYNIVTHPEARDLELPLPKGEIFPEVAYLEAAWKAYVRTNAFNIILCLFTAFKMMNRSPEYGMVVRTMTKSGPDLAKFFLVFVQIFATFSIMGMLLFGTALPEFKDAWRACQTCFQIVVGEFGLQDLQEVDPVAAPVFFFLFVGLVYFLLINIILAIMMESYASLREASAKAKQEMLVRYDFPILKEFFLMNVQRVDMFLPKFMKLHHFVTSREILRRLEVGEPPPRSSPSLGSASDVLTPGPERVPSINLSHDPYHKPKPGV